MTQHGQERQAGVLYAENHSAMRWPYAFHIAFWACVLIAGVAWLSVGANFGVAIVAAVGTIGLLSSLVITRIMWPTGIQVSTDGIRIGGIGRRRRPGRDLPWGDAQRKQVFFCPWDAVRRAAVVTDQATLRNAADLRKGRAVKLGVLWAPFARAALLIEVDPRAAVIPEFRPPDTERPFFRSAHMTGNELSPVWYVPTKRPEALGTLLAQHVGPARSDPRLPSHLRALLEKS